MNNQTSRSTNGTSDYIFARHTGKHTLDIDFGAGVTGTVKILSRPPGGTGKYLRYDGSADGQGDPVAITASEAFEVPGNREYAFEVSSIGGTAGSITATLNEVEAP